MKRLFLLAFLCFISVASAVAQSDSLLVRKGVKVAFQDGPTLSKSQLESLLDSSDYALYAKGHKKMLCSTPWFIVSSLGFSMVQGINNSYISVYIDRAQSPLVRWVEEVLRPTVRIDPLVFDEQRWIIVGVPFAIALSTTIIAYKMNVKGSKMIEEACDGWNSSHYTQKPKPEVSLSFGPANLGLTLSF